MTILKRKYSHIIDLPSLPLCGCIVRYLHTSSHFILLFALYVYTLESLLSYNSQDLRLIIHFLTHLHSSLPHDLLRVVFISPSHSLLTYTCLITSSCLLADDVSMISWLHLRHILKCCENALCMCIYMHVCNVPFHQMFINQSFHLHIYYSIFLATIYIT
jgi:hypothetical protein